MELYTVYPIVAAIGFVLGTILYKIFIPLLRKVKLGQKILEIGPSWHKAKEGTPNLGGVIFIVACLAAFAVGCLLVRMANVETVGYLFYAFVVFSLALSQALIGFVDDYVKLFKKRNKGLSATQKLVLQFISVAAFLAFCGFYGIIDTVIDFPWGSRIDFGFFYYVIMLLVIVYVINCANLTDGIDGLAGSIALIVITMFFLFGNYIHSVGINLVTSSLFGALISFLVFNFYPAKIFMGDTGSLFLGGFIAGVSMMTENELILLLVGIIWIIEGLSVVLQVLSFKLTGKRIFKMSPIHHHFEKCGWSEIKIVAVFSFITVVFSTLAYYLLTK